MQFSFGHTGTLSRFALAAVALCSATALAPAQVPFLPVPTQQGRSYDLSINTGANRAIDMGWLGQQTFFDLTTGASLGTPIGAASAWALTPDRRMVRTAVTTKTRALSAGLKFSYPGWGVTGGTIQVFDLTTPTPSLLTPGFTFTQVVPHDIALARSDSMAIVNGTGGVVWVNMSTGANLITLRPGTQFTNTMPRFCHGSMVQSVIANDKRAVVLRSLGGAGAIDVYDTAPFPGGAPVLINSTATVDAVGNPVEPYDLAMSPNQNWAGVMTNGGQFYIVDLQANIVTAKPGVGLAIQGIGADQFDMKDCVQLTDTSAVAAGINNTVAPFTGNIGVYSLGAVGTPPAFYTINGRPHDLAVSPNQKTAAVHASAAHLTPGGLVVLGLSGAGSTLRASLPSAGFERVAASGGVVQMFPNPDGEGEPDVEEEGDCWEQEVLESVRLSDTRLAVIGNTWAPGGLPWDASSAGTGYIEFYDIVVTTPALIVSHAQSTLSGDGDVHDLDLSPNGAILAVYGESVPTTFYKMSDGLLYGTSTATGNITYPHGVDAINLDDTRSVCAASFGGNPGVTSVEITDTCAAFTQIIMPGCPPSATSFMGVAPGSSTSISANNLTLQCTGVPSGTSGRFFYGPRMTTPVFIPTGGYSCVTGPIQRLPVTFATGTVMTYTVNYVTPPLPTGLIRPGDTWYFQCSYNDPTSPPLTTNVSDAMQVTFGP